MHDAGDIRTLYERYCRSVFARARAILGDDAAAKDAMQEVFLRAMGHSRVVLREPSPMAWLFRVTTNLCLNLLRDEKRRNEILSQNAANDVDPGDAEVRVVVGGILRLVPVEMQEIAVYYHLDEMSHEEIAKLVGLSRRTIGNRLVAFQSVIDTLVEKEQAS
ncbi:MAG TPA: sigma-70 family RNA polymerase sigma factor [Polyangia bacterium]|nr:sigma-70 family RNA polymerase sigma factor [Polyangia bacterium]